ncbi:methyltransferase domain-containing protein [Hymenobacter sp. RP-2-7]|uniref:Methyltransferase domain-containing protein n=1 Tax=Hymenobacter polaris TaxID=2682546 RepID=A0A7Y0FKR2_9BACT|nr:methyltransferase domain-containing protein [Hymenobacter polaris]NML63659.1 methyltransferase domain-containing protein [Hymenobacter polaris]
MTSDACALPFPNQQFDAVSCRMGFLFFPDMLLATQEMYRVLKPGGRLATSVWSAPPHNL